MKILVINGPNLNLLGRREPGIYGHKTYGELIGAIETWARDLAMEVDCFQSNHEGAIIDKIQEAPGQFDAIILNAGGYTHSSVAILDALLAVALPAVEVHLSDPATREPFRRISYPAQACEISYSGLGFEGYHRALLYLKDRLARRP